MILVLAAYIVLLSVAVKSFSGNKRHRWIYSGYLTTFLLPFLVFVIFLRIIAPLAGAGIGVAAIGLLFAIATAVTGFIYLFIGYTSKNLRGE